MDEEEQKKKKKTTSKNINQINFKPSADVKGIRIGGQFIVKSFTVRRARPMEMLRLLGFSPTPPRHRPQNSEGEAGFASSTTAYLPTNFTILAHRAWHTLTLGLAGAKKSKVLIFVFESEAMKSAADRAWPPMVALGDVNRKLVRGLVDCDMARFKVRKGSLTFYLYAVRRTGGDGFSKAGDLRRILERMAAMSDFLDHTAMLALPSQRSILFLPPVAMAH